MFTAARREHGRMPVRSRRQSCSGIKPAHPLRLSACSGSATPLHGLVQFSPVPRPAGTALHCCQIARPEIGSRRSTRPKPNPRPVILRGPSSDTIRRQWFTDNSLKGGNPLGLLFPHGLDMRSSLFMVFALYFGSRLGISASRPGP
jgi:hypothetical protein